MPTCRAPCIPSALLRRPQEKERDPAQRRTCRAFHTLNIAIAVVPVMIGTPVAIQWRSVQPASLTTP